MTRKYLIVIFSFLIAAAASSCLITTTLSNRTNTKSERTNSEKSRGLVMITIEDPELVVIPKTYVYSFYAGDTDIYFYGGYWWRYWDNSWYRAKVHTGTWLQIEIRHVPAAIRNLSPKWKNKYQDAPRVRWHDTRHQWQEWEKNKYWEKKKWRR